MNKNGIALIVTLILTLISMMLIGALMNTVLTETKISGDFKQYTSALESAKGGVEEFMSYFGNVAIHEGSEGDTSFICKVNRNTAVWNTTCKNYMKAKGYTLENLSSHSVIEDIINYPDMIKTFGDYKVYIKVTDVKGSSDGVWYYSVDVVSQNKINKKQRAWISLLFRTE